MGEWGNNWLSNNVHGRVDPTPPSNPHPWNREVGHCGDHRLQVNWRMEFWDVVPVHGAVYLGRARSSRDAFSRWRNYLMTIGERAEEATFRDV